MTDQTRQVIAMDCAPGYPRPGDLLPEVLVSTGLEYRPPRSTVFGCWTWDYTDVDPAVWAAAKPILAQRIGALYTLRIIRYGAWGDA